jgi:galactokinase
VSGGPVTERFVPGRIEVLGKHTDYAGGRSLVGAVDRGIRLRATARPDGRVTVTDERSGERAEFALSPDLRPPPGHWSSYPMTVARRLARDFAGPLSGADLSFSSDLPAAAGLSSSSALIVATYLGLAAVNDLAERAAGRVDLSDPEELARYLASVESGREYGPLRGDLGVGTRGGSEDHVAILCGRPGELLQYAFDPPHPERTVALPAGHLFAVASSGVRAEKAGAARERYNRAALLMEEVLRLWQEAGGEGTSPGAVIASAPDALSRLRAVVERSESPLAAPEELLRRLDHFAAEAFEIVPAAAEALAAGRLDAFGALVDRSQALAESMLRNQVPETVHLARSARALGAPAASAFGAGFGGSVWALVEEAAAPAFLSAWRADYLRRFPERGEGSEFFVVT